MENASTPGKKEFYEKKIWKKYGKKGKVKAALKVYQVAFASFVNFTCSSLSLLILFVILCNLRLGSF